MFPVLVYIDLPVLNHPRFHPASVQQIIIHGCHYVKMGNTDNTIADQMKKTVGKNGSVITYVQQNKSAERTANGRKRTFNKIT